MEIELNESPSRVQTLERLRKDLRFVAFYLSPYMAAFDSSSEWLAKTHNLPLDIADAWARELLETGFWQKTQNGIKPGQAHLGLGNAGVSLTISEFLTMMAQLLCRVTETGPCWAETHTVATSLDLKREFISQIALALKNLIEKSKNAPGETVFSWAHVALDTLKALQAEEDL